MKNINRNNYESFLIDKLDGNLSLELQQELDTFLLLNPDIQDEFEQLDTVSLPIQDISFENKVSLKLPDHHTCIDASNMEQFIIAYYENDLSKSKLDELQEFMRNHPSSQILFQLYARTHATADEVVFENKSLLYHNVPVRRLLWWHYAAAAMLFIACTVSLYLFIDHQTPSQVSMKVESVPASAPIVQPSVTVHEEGPRKIETVLPSNELLTQSQRKNQAPAYLPCKSFIAAKSMDLDEKIIQKEMPEMPLTVMLDEPNSTKPKDYLSIAELGIQNIKTVADEATIQQGIRDEKRLHWTDVAAYVLAKINKGTGSHLMLEKATDEDGYTYAYGLTSKGFEIEKK
jgi:hypothetical protein